MLRSTIISCLLGICLARDKRFFFLGSSTDALERYNVDKTQISVSGISSGGAMATQIHVIYSSDIMGAGMIAGVPFACTSGFGAATAMTSCMKFPSTISVTVLEGITDSGAAVGNIDSTSNMRNDKVYIFDGKDDSVVNPGIGPKIKSFYTHYLADANSQIKEVYSLNAEHGQPTFNYGAACNQLSSADYLNSCNYSAAYELMNFIYGGNLTKPSPGAAQTGQLLKYDQTAFFYISTPSMYSMDDDGYIYVPQRCASKTRECKLHVAFHGCQMGASRIGTNYVEHGGYNEVADLNDIIILYPQVIITPTNLAGCWDWFGYTGPLFATNSGFQPTAIKRMIDKVTG